MTFETISEHACFGGVQGFYRHASDVVGLPMQFGVYVPPQAKERPVPALFYLAGLTCTEETFAIKAGAQRFAAEHGLMLVTPDTSPRKTGIAKEDADWEVGTAAGFYVNATQPPWSAHFRMHDYVAYELRDLVRTRFPMDPERVGIFGHSMGGHGALVLALRNPKLFRSVSAFAPICAPSQCPWGEKAFTLYLGTDRKAWEAWDATALVRASKAVPYPDGILVDQGLADKFLEVQLKPELFEEACAAVGQPLTLRRHPGYDHGYYFIATFVHEHVAFHARRLSA